MKRLYAPLSVGVMLVLGVAGLLYALGEIRGTTYDATNSYTVWARFSDASGLAVDSSVTMAGIQVGVIEAIVLEQDATGQVSAKVTLRVKNDVSLRSGGPGESGPNEGGAVVFRENSSILGDYFLSLLPGVQGGKLAAGDEIPKVVGKTGLDAVMEQLSKVKDLYPKMEKIVTNLADVSEGLSTAMGGKDGGERLKVIVENAGRISEDMKQISDDVKRVSGAMKGFVDDGTVNTIAMDLASTSRDAASVVGRIDELMSAGDVEQLVANLVETSEAISRFGKDLEELVESGIKPQISKLDRTFGNLDRFASNIATLSDHGGRTLGQTLDNFKTISEEALAVIGRSKGDVETSLGTLKGTLAAAQGSIGKLDEVLDDVRAVTRDVRAGKGTIGRLLTDDKLIGQVEEVVDDTASFIKQYTLMQTHVQMSSAWYWNQQAARTAFELRFQPKDDKYYLFQLVDDPRGSTKQTTTVTQTNDPALPSVLKENETRTTSSLKFTFQFAKRWYFLTGRFGIMENTGGAGVDFTFFRDRLDFQFDLFDFAMDHNPRLRTQVAFEVIRHLFLYGGVDDLVNPRMRDYYFGAGLRFTDEDIRSLLMAAPSLNL
ncbi:MAG: MlaD family protein [Pseudomonadota bacterium]